jgi:long-subunit acyl-CoA synthetase (AMP-forming)
MNMFSVPRVWNTIYERVNTQISQSNVIRRTLFAKAFNSRQADVLNCT